MFLLCVALLISTIPQPHPIRVETLPPHCQEAQYPPHETFIPVSQGQFSDGKDFQVNEEPAPAVFDQANPAAAYLRSGHIVTAWCDGRNGDYDIFCRISAADGTLLRGDFVANDENGSSLQCVPTVSEWADGFVLCWTDRRNGNPDIYGRLYSSTGDPLGSSFELSDDEGGFTQSSPSVAPVGDRGFLVCWEDGREGNLDIYGQRCDSTGTPHGMNFKISDDLTAKSQRHPRVGSDSSGGCIVVWRDYRAGLYPLTFAQRFEPDGTPIGTNFMVSDHVPNNAQWNPAVASNPDGDLLVVFEDWRDGNYDIFGQAYDSTGSPYGPNFLISIDESGSDQSYPSVSADWQGGFVVTWIDLRNGGYDIYAQVLRDGAFQGGPFKVSEVTEASQLYPAAASHRKGDFTISWVDARDGTWDIYAQRYEHDGSPTGVNFRVNGDKIGSSQLYPDIASNRTKEFCVSWLDARSGDYDVHAQILRLEGDRVGSSLLVNDDTSESYQWAPSIAPCAGTTFVVVWDDYRNKNWDIYGQFFRWDGSPVGENFVVNDDISGREQGFCKAASSLAGNLVFVWLDKRDEGSSSWDVYGQRLDPHGRFVGSNFKVNDDEIGNDQRSASVACALQGNFCVVWMDTRNDEYDIYGQRYDAAGNPAGMNFKVNDDAPGNTQTSPSAQYGSDGSLWVTWSDSRSGDYDIYVQEFDSAGFRVGGNLRINDDPGAAAQADPSISGYGDHLVISWTDYRNGSANADVYAQKIQGGAPIGANYRVNMDSGYKYQGQPSLSMSNDYIYHAWRDSRVPGQGYDVFAKTEVFDGQTRRVLPQKAKRVSRLHPVRRSVQGIAIEFDLEGGRSSVELVIYGPDGRRIRTLCDGALSPGTHEVTWNLRDDRHRPVAPGVYFCTLRTGSVVDREKIIVLD